MTALSWITEGLNYKKKYVFIILNFAKDFQILLGKTILFSLCDRYHIMASDRDRKNIRHIHNKLSCHN